MLISFISSISKILTKAYGLRLKCLRSKMIPTAQTGFIPGCCNTKNLILPRNALYWAKIKCPQAVIVALTFAKACDRVQWLYLHKKLPKLDFGPRWRCFIRILYSDRMAYLNIDGHLTAPFQITEKFLQRDSLSPYLFVLETVSIINMIEQLWSTHGFLLSL